MKRLHQLGVTLLELILTLVIAGVLITLSLRSYQTYHFHLEQREVAYDVNLIMQSLADYYHSQTCNEGVFPTVDTDVYATLVNDGYLNPAQLKQPTSLIASWQAKVIDTGSVSTKTEDNKPIYMLQVIAQLAPSLNATQVIEADNRWHAKSVDATHVGWQALPNFAHHFSAGSSFARLDSQSKLFRQQEEFVSSSQGYEHAGGCLN